MKRRGNNSKFIIILLCLLAFIAIVLFFIRDDSHIKILNKGDLVSSAKNANVLQNHAEKMMILLSKEVPLVKVPKHPTSKGIKELSKTIDTILEHGNLSGAITGVSIRNSENEIIYEHNGDVRLIPASNMKIITTVAALEVLGPEYQYETAIKIDGEIKKGTLHGDLYLVGKGDPTLQAKDFELLAKSIKEHGIDKIKGSIYADDSWYDHVRYSQDLSWRHENNYVGNAISSLTVAANDDYLLGAVIVDVYPAKEIGQKPEVVITPETDYIRIVNKGKTVSAGSPLTLSDNREHGSNVLHIEGDIPQKTQHYQRWRAVWEPTGYALDLFAKGLEKNKIKFSKDNLSVKAAPEVSETIVTRKSVPLKEIILPFMKKSNNGLGEMLVKEMGRVELNDGSWESGIKVMQRALISLGLNIADISLRDGSGMSERNLVSANFFTELLFAVQNKPWFDDFEKSFPFAGERDPTLGGTLSYRLSEESTKGRVKAKTGTLNKVSTLSGYVETKDHELLNFSILMNNYIREPVTQIQDEIVTVIAEMELK